jgi:hypothetical protein
MTEAGPRAVREFYVEPDGRRWSLTRDLETGHPYVLHKPADDKLEVELDLGSFLVLFEGRERDELLRLIAAQLLDTAPPDQPRQGAIGPLWFLSRWKPNNEA